MSAARQMRRLAARGTRAVAAAVAAAVVLSFPAPAQAQAPDGGDIPRMADGKPDLSGVWWTGGDLGSPGFMSARLPPDPDAPEPVEFQSLYQPWAAEHAATLSDKDDPTLQCVSTAFGTLRVRLLDVGTIGQIVATPDLMVFLTETFHGYQLISTDGREHRTLPPFHRGDSVGHWEGDSFVVETVNFTDDTWLFAEGEVSFHSDELRIVERYRLADADSLIIEATIHDPAVLTEPWVVPTQRLVRAPDDQLLPLDCTAVETQELMDAASALGE